MIILSFDIQQEYRKWKQIVQPFLQTAVQKSQYHDSDMIDFTTQKPLKRPFQLPSCLQNTFHLASTPDTPFSTAPIPSKHTSPTANTLNALCNCSHALKTHFTQQQHLKPPFRLCSCPQEHISPGVIT